MSSVQSVTHVLGSYRVDRVHVDPPAPRGLRTGEVAAILAAIPVQRRRDRLLFRLIAELGLRVGEALTLQVEDVDLAATMSTYPCSGRVAGDARC